MSIIIIALTTLVGANYFISSEEMYNQEFYQPVIEEFESYSLAHYERILEVENRYHAGNIEEDAALINLNEDSSIVDTPKTDTLISINSATVEEFEILPGIGPSIASNIVRYRKENGKFESVDDLLNVRGIGKTRLENIRPYLKL